MKNALKASPHLFGECERCGIIAKWHDEEPTEVCQGFYTDPRAWDLDDPMLRVLF